MMGWLTIALPRGDKRSQRLRTAASLMSVSLSSNIEEKEKEESVFGKGKTKVIQIKSKEQAIIDNPNKIIFENCLKEVLKINKNTKRATTPVTTPSQKLLEKLIRTEANEPAVKRYNCQFSLKKFFSESLSFQRQTRMAKKIKNPIKT